MSGIAEPGPVENHRGRENGVLVYPVFSRRSKGLSLGINLFPAQKRCSFDCPYCEVFPFKTDAVFEGARVEAELVETIRRARESRTPLRDICFSGNGEPSQSPHFFPALEQAIRIRDHYAPEAALVLITNGTGLLEKECFNFLVGHALGPAKLSIWLKLDAGTAAWYEKINRSKIPYENLIDRIRAFVSRAPVTAQTMLCSIGGMSPPAEEAAAWEELVAGLALESGGRGGIQAAHLYGKARPAPEDPLCGKVPAAYLEDRAASLRLALTRAGRGNIPVEVYP